MLSRFRWRWLIHGFLGLAVAETSSRAVEPPRVIDPGWEITGIATEPNLVTPIACCFNDRGELLVIESHTHFPPEQYAGPKQDRVYRFIDSDGDGILDKQSLFREGGIKTMGIATLEDGWIALATRSELVRIRDRDGDGVADEEETLLKLETAADYPHNGLSGLIVGHDQRLYVGLGENFGERYELIGSDGSKQVGGGEGGNVFRVTQEGRDVERIATGFWNPFGMYIDPQERLWVVENDPDASPPCRLLHTVPSGDYGFQFRFGRAGTHPLLAWDGELPGTLPMAAGTGEAPCAVVGVEDSLWVSSWGDNRIERYVIEPRGASWTARRDVIAQGDSRFRPVGMAVAKDGSIYVTDWVDRSYSVHQAGRLWRISRKAGMKIGPLVAPELTIGEHRARALHRKGTSLRDRLESLADADPFVRQAAIVGLVENDQLTNVNREQLSAPEAKASLLSAFRWLQMVAPDRVTTKIQSDWIAWGLANATETVALTALRWAAERGAKEHLESVREVLNRPELSPQLFSAAIATLAYLEAGSAARSTRDPVIDRLFVQIAEDPSRSPAVRALAIRELASDSKEPSDEKLGNWIEPGTSRDLAIEIVRRLTGRQTSTAFDVLSKLAANEELDVQTRADALAGLSRRAGEYSEVLRRLSLPRANEVVRSESQRMLKRGDESTNIKRPNKSDIDGWLKLVGTDGDRDAGRRVFSRGTCINCHAHTGYGASTGPDLTTLAGSMTRKRILESLLSPSKEVGPLYVPWQVLTTDGRVLTGLKLDRAGVGDSIRFQGADGDYFDVALGDIEEQNPLAQSIMPAGLEDTMSIDELRDLLKFLAGD